MDFVTVTVVISGQAAVWLAGRGDSSVTASHVIERYSHRLEYQKRLMRKRREASKPAEMDS